MKLGSLARDFASSFDDEKQIDYQAAGLYLPAGQVVLAIIVSACSSVVCCWLIPEQTVSAVRTLAITATLGVVIVRKPVKVVHARGVNTLFTALRPGVVLYVMALTVEQLLHSCVTEDASYENGWWRRLLYHVAMTVVILAAFMRSRHPRSESDVPFLIALLSMLCVAILPPPALALSGPLCSPPTLYAAAERVLRAFLFGSLYVVLCYCSAPISNSLPDQLVCVFRASAASFWTIGCHIFLLALAPVQIILLLWVSFGASNNLQYDSVALVGHETPAPVTAYRVDIDADVEEDEGVAPQRPIQQVNSNGLKFSIPVQPGTAAPPMDTFAAVAARLENEM